MQRSMFSLLTGFIFILILVAVLQYTQNKSYQKKNRGLLIQNAVLSVNIELKKCLAAKSA